MANPPTSTDIVNQALYMMGDNQPLVTGVAPTFDNSAAGLAAQQLYIPCVRTVGRRFGWDFSRNTALLTLSGNPAPFPYTYEYLYPPFGVQIRQVMPQTLTDINNPLPAQWSVGNTVVGGTITKVIWTNLKSAQVVWSNTPTEATWDPLFREAVVRQLAAEFSLALASRLDTGRANMDAGNAFEQLGETRDS
jgi:hypothetical protein